LGKQTGNDVFGDVMKILSVNPFTEEINEEFETLSFGEAREEITQSRQSQLAWKLAPLRERAERINNLAAVLEESKRKYAEMITGEMGKPIREALAEVEKCRSICRYYADHAEEMLKDEVVKTVFKKSYIAFEPLGVILVIMPWNYPFLQVFRSAVPIIAAGNTVVLKHASNVPICAREIEKAFLGAGFPGHVFRTLLVHSHAAMRIIREDMVDGVALTGSIDAGKTIGALAGPHVKKCVLELGGSDPFIVLEDADIDKAAEAGVKARFVNGGQSCVAAKRLIVLETVAGEFTESLIHFFHSLKVGDPMDNSVHLGPMATRESLETLHRQLDDAANKGAKITEGPSTPTRGFFFRPAIVLNANSAMAVAQEEVFGPIASIFIVKDQEEALTLANSTAFGLGATIWSRNIGNAEKLAKRLDAGFVSVNRPVKSDPMLPFGGIKKSGLGREFSHYGLKEFTNVKTVVVEDCC
jgi:succinate-semialdehyde dehydrogenase / glutarate-semialdehyde dehydrogenase